MGLAVSVPEPAGYDDPVFFAAYRRMRADRAGFNEELEQPALARLLPDTAGLDVLELGCGDGSLARRLAAAGARSVLATDPSARMLALAARHPHPRVRLLRVPAERLRLPDACLDLVVSSLALHYVADYRRLVERVAGWLRPGGRFAYSVEHPVCTARDPMTGWVARGERTVWPVDDYAREGTRVQSWFGVRVTKHHRRLATLIGDLTAAGLTVTAVDEPYPDDDTLARRPDLAEHLRRPPLLLVGARKPEAVRHG